MYGGGCNNSSSSDDDKSPVENPDDTNKPDDSNKPDGDGGDTETKDIEVSVTVAFENCNADICKDGNFLLPKAEVDDKGEDKDPAAIILNFDELFDASAYEKLTFDLDAETHNMPGAGFVLLGKGDWNPLIGQWGGVGVWSEEGKYNYSVELGKLEAGKSKEDLKTLKAIKIIGTSKYALTVYDSFKFEGGDGTATLKLKFD